MNVYLRSSWDWFLPGSTRAQGKEPGTSAAGRNVCEFSWCARDRSMRGKMASVADLRREVEIAREGLKTVDEDIKKLIGRDPSEPRYWNDAVSRLKSLLVLFVARLSCQACWRQKGDAQEGLRGQEHRWTHGETTSQRRKQPAQVGLIEELCRIKRETPQNNRKPTRSALVEPGSRCRLCC